MIYHQLKYFIKDVYYTLRKLRVFISNRNDPKIFCIGRNKTGTTSMSRLFKNLNIPVAPQRPAEKLLKDWINDDFTRIIKFVKYNGIVFQDIPFSLPKTFEALEKAYPDSKFILTVRDSPEVWYKSVTKSQSKLFNNRKLPNKEVLQNTKYIHKGWIWQMHSAVYNPPEDDIYNEDLMKKHYLNYNESVIEYFKDKPNRLLVINLKEPDVATKISKFLNLKKDIKYIPWENKT